LVNYSAETAQKILSPVPYAQGFHFYMPDGHFTGETATSLCTFLRDMESVDVQSIKFHFERDDFQKWIRNIIRDEELASRIDKLGKKLPEETLQQQLTAVVQKRISELQHIEV
jgi:hypothetical protein